MEDTEYLIMKRTKRSYVVNVYMVTTEAKHFDTSVLMFLLENHADRVREEHGSSEVKFTFTGTSYPLVIWKNVEDGTWSTRIKMNKPRSVLSYGPDVTYKRQWEHLGEGESMASAAEQVAIWQSKGTNKKKEEVVK